MRAKEEAFRILESALSIASSGVEEAEVSLGGGDLGVTRFAQNQVHPSSEHNLECIMVRVASKGRTVTLETTDISTEGIKEIAQQAKSRAEHLPESLEGPSFPEPQSYDFVEAYDPETEATKAIDRMALTSRAINAALKNGLSASGLVMVRRGLLGLDGQCGVYAVANTRGLLAYHPETRIRYSLSMERRGGGPRGWAEDESFTSAAIDAENLVAIAANKALLGGELRDLKPGRYAAVLEPAAVGALVGIIGRTAGAGMMKSGRSFLSDRIGEKVAGGNITIYDDHTHPLHRGLPFDIEGVARRRVMLIKDGVAESAVYGWDSAVRFDAQPTGHKVRLPFDGVTEAAQHLVMEGGEATLSDMLGELGRGVLVSRLGSVELIDSRTLLVSGATGGGLFLVEKGEVVAPLADMRFTVSLLDLLGSVESLGASIWTRGGVVPPIRVGELNLAAGTKL